MDTRGNRTSSPARPAKPILATGHYRNTLANLLRDHYVEHVSQSGKLYALEVLYCDPRRSLISCMSTWLDVTDWSIAQLYRWLGY